MAELNSTAYFVYKFQSNISEVTKETIERTTEADGTTKEFIKTETDLKASVEETTVAFKQQEVQTLKQIAVLTTMSTAVSGVTNGLIQMGLVSGENAERLKMLNSYMQTMVGFANGIKALTLAQSMFNMESIKGAVVTTFNKIMESPWRAAAAGLALGAAIGVAGAFASGSGGGNTINNIIIDDSSGGQAQVANNLNSTINNGRIV